VSLVREGRQLAAYSGVSCQKEVMLRKRRGEFGSRRHAAADFFVFRCSISGNIPEPTAAYQNIAEPGIEQKFCQVCTQLTLFPLFN
jgi:hypothetical protein